MKLNIHGICIISLLLASSLLTACATTPYSRLKTPSISGVITDNNQPVHGLSVYLSIKGEDKLCFKAVAESLTNTDGEFHLAAAREQLPRPPVMKYYLDEWNICTRYNNQRINLYSGNRYDTGSVNLSLNLKCELNKTTLNARCTAH